MSINKSLFGTINNGQEVYLYTITNKSGASVSLHTIGAGIQAIKVPDKNGLLGDVVLGFDDPEPYLDGDTGFQGLVVGRVANRITGAKFSIDGVEYHTPVNQGEWTLHGGGRISHSIWDVKETTDNSITFEIFSPDMEDGFPGNFTFTVKYTFTEDNVLRVDYTILSDKKTVANPTNHAYFNLSCKPDSTIENHYLKINADRFTETDENSLPTGKLCPLAGTMLDFAEMHKIGDKIDEPFYNTTEGIGYDNNYCLTNKLGEFAEAAVLYDEESGRQLEVYTDLPGIQLYCGGWLPKEPCGKKGDSTVAYRRGAALETQFYPNSVNFSDEFPFTYVEPNKEFKTTTEFRFSVK